MALAAVVAAVIAPSAVLAREPQDQGLPADSTAGDGLRVGAGLGLAWRFGDRCTRDGDMVSCSSGPLLATLQLDTRYRIGQLSFGLVASGGRALGGEAVSVSDGEEPPSIARWMWRAAGEARWHPRLVRSTDLWIGAEVGLAGEIVSRSDEASDTSDLTVGGGAGIGAGIPLGPAVMFTLETRLLVADLQTQTAFPPQSPFWLTFTAGVSFGL
jgi:hypothetical protein